MMMMTKTPAGYDTKETKLESEVFEMKGTIRIVSVLRPANGIAADGAISHSALNQALIWLVPPTIAKSNSTGLVIVVVIVEPMMTDLWLCSVRLFVVVIEIRCDTVLKLT